MIVSVHDQSSDLKNRIFDIFKTDYSSYFNIANSLVDLAISFRSYRSFFQIASNCPKLTALFTKTKHNWATVHDLIILLVLFKTYEWTLKCFCLKNKYWKYFYKLPPFWFCVVMIAKFDDDLKYYLRYYSANYWVKWQTWLNIYSLFKEIFHTSNK